jgi:hypothetical protein
VVFVVDRKDLDYQTQKEFDAFEKGSVDATENTKHLVKQLSDNTKLIVTTLQKLNTAITKEKHGNKINQLRNKKVVFIFDECHRSQFGEAQKNLNKKFKKFYQFGFTGTPIFPENALGAETTAGVLVRVVALDLASRLACAQQSHATTGHDAFFHSSAGSVQGVFHAGLLFLHFDFGRSADLDHCHAASQLGHALLQLFTVVVAGRFFDLDADLLDAGFDVGSGTSTVDFEGVTALTAQLVGGNVDPQVEAALSVLAMFEDLEARTSFQ